MVICVFRDCTGHEDKADAILHGLDHLAAEIADLKRKQRTSITKEGKIMTIAQDILAAETAEAGAVTALTGVVTTAVAKLEDVETQLADLLANGTLSDDDKAALQSALDTATASKTELDASLAEVNAALNPAPPADGTGDGGTPPVDSTPVDGE